MKPATKARRLLALAMAPSLALIACTPAQAAQAPAAVNPPTLVAGVQAAAATSVVQIPKASLETSRKAPLRASATGSAKVLVWVPAGAWHASTARAKNGWYRISYKGYTGFMHPQNLRAFNPGNVKVNSAKEYVSTQNGAKDLWFTTSTATLRWRTQKFTVPAGTPIWKLNRATKGTIKVNGGGFRNATMDASLLARTSPANTSNTSKISLKDFKKLKPGSISTKYLARTNFGTQTLIGAPAVDDLNTLAAAFKKRFGEDLYIDLGYRSASQQWAIYRDIGPRLAAKPGTSIHEKGLSFDVPEHKAYGWNTARFNWLVANAPTYGWEHPARVKQYTSKGKLNPYREYWHFDYVGAGK